MSEDNLEARVRKLERQMRVMRLGGKGNTPYIVFFALLACLAVISLVLFSKESDNEVRKECVKHHTLLECEGTFVELRFKSEPKDEAKK